MKNIQLRQLIRESINDYIREIDEAGNVAALEAKMNKTEEAINKRKKMVAMEGLDEDMKGMIDEKKVKDINAEIKALEKSLVKYGKQLEKLKSKGEKVVKSEDTEEKEVVDEINIDENVEYESDKDNPYAIRKKNPDAKFYFTHKGKEDFEDEEEERYDVNGKPDPNGEYDAGANYLGPKMEENKINENSAYNRIVRKMEAEISPETRAEANRLSSRGEMDYAMFWNELSNETKADIADLYIDAFDEGFDSFEEAMDNDPEFFYSLFNSLINMDDEDDDDYLNEAQMLHMQKLAGIISETEYKTKLEEAKKKKMTSAQKEKKEDIVKGMKKSKSFGKSKEEKAKMYATATKLATKK